MANQFDYIIVGAGSAGCVLANRLSANGKNRVLLLEAGPKDSHATIKMPMGFAMLMHDKKRNWCYKTEAEPNMAGREIEWPKGKVLGGSSSINGMVYIRGHQEDFNHWQSLGCEGWAWQDVLPYFIKSEHNVRGANAYHGEQGPLWVDDVINRFPLAEQFRQAGVAIGHYDNPDFNGERQDGIGYFQVNIKNGRRASAADCYLKPVLSRNNLTVLSDCLVEKVVVENLRAQGVEVLVKGRRQRFLASKEVIVAAGTVESPKLLELSGIGQAEHLASLNIPLVKHLSGVGENLQDHLTVNVLHHFKGINTFMEETTPLKMVRNLYQYFVKHNGLLTHPAAEVGVFMQSHAELNRPNLQLHFAPAAGEVTERGNLKTVPGTTATVCQLNPKSRGSVHIQSNRVEQYPAIRANYLAERYDQEVMVAAIRKTREIFASPVLAPYNDYEIAPGHDMQSDEDILSYVRQQAVSVYHAVGTCRMGVDEQAVVDPQLQVHGIEGLRVVDASVMPTITAGNTHAATVMIAEKAADMILAKNS